MRPVRSLGGRLGTQLGPAPPRWRPAAATVQQQQQAGKTARRSGSLCHQQRPAPATTGMGATAGHRSSATASAAAVATNADAASGKYD
eukprot:SAG22_NODE_9410_length_591_cov_0.756098_1_plen_87_part_01